ncbi:alpha/beta hydrolase [Fibrobacterota bacterium]
MKFISKTILILLTAFTFVFPYSEQTISFLKRDTLTLKASLYLPDTGNNRPALIMLHEGGFTEGSRHCFMPHGRFFTGKGYAVLSVGYRLVQQGGAYPEALKDCIEALRWLKANAGDYGIDKDRIVLIGSSAGAYLATMTALAGGLPQDIRNGHGGFPKETLEIKGVVSSFGMYDWEQCQWKGSGFIKRNEAKAASPIHYCQHAKAEFLILAGERDRLFNLKQAEQFTARLKELGKKASLEVKPKQDHGGICVIDGEISRWALPIIDEFLKRIFPSGD